MATAKPSKTRNRKTKKGQPESLRGKKLRQRQFIAAFTGNNFHIGRACEAAGIARCTFADWRDNDPAFQAGLQDAVDSKIDDLEEALHSSAISGDTVALIFSLKCLARHRGYSDKESVNKQVSALLMQVLSETISPREAAYRINAMGVPLPEVLALELKRSPAGNDEQADIVNISTEELERRAEERFAAIQKQREEFLPQRRAEVAEIKERMKDQDSFAPEMFVGNSP